MAIFQRAGVKLDRIVNFYLGSLVGVDGMTTAVTAR